MKRRAAVILGVLGFAEISIAQNTAGIEPAGEEPAAETEGAEPDTSETDAAEIDALEGEQEPLIFRWYDIMGMAHDTTDASTIPPGSNFEVKGGLFKKGDLQRRRSWWRARKSRLQAELRGAQDELGRAQIAFSAAVDKNESGERQAELATKVETWKSLVARRQRDIKELKTEAAKAKIPQRWLRD